MLSFVFSAIKQGDFGQPIDAIVVIQGLLNLGRIDVDVASCGNRDNCDGKVEGHGSNRIAEGLGILFSRCVLRGQRGLVLPLLPKETRSLEEDLFFISHKDVSVA